MQDFRPLWKYLNHSRSVQPYHVVQYAVIKALYQANGDPEKATEISLRILNASFTPTKNENKLNNGYKPLFALYKAIDQAHYKANIQFGDILGGPSELLKRGTDELKNYNIVLYNLYNYDRLKEYFGRNYVYIFVRQDIFPEYQLVQSSHVALKLGLDMASTVEKDRLDQLYNIAFDDLYFAVIGVPNESELKSVKAYLEGLNVKSVEFVEPDIGYEITAIASYPVPVNKRKPFRHFKRLKFQAK